ncbi:MAG: peptidoglycan-binding domain-containing protein [Pseudomonadota bacterium]|nr:peptidoglycan-binding domain-containing protein [Pseudomonadota bacterium]
MGVLQARLLFVAFIGVAVAITYNALYLQKGPQSRVSAPATTASVPTAKPSTPAADKDKPAAASKPGASVETIRAIQRELVVRGYDAGVADGVPGVLTRASILAYQHDNKLPMTGEASEALLKRILLGTSVGTEGLGGEIAEETTALVKAVQQILANMGYSPGAIDGLFGGATKSAIETFEKERGMKPKGRISSELLKELMHVTGAKLSSLSQQ